MAMPDATTDAPEPPLIRLASASPRRRELLAGVGVTAEVQPVDLDETPRPGEAPEAYVRRLSEEKARAGAVGSALPTLGSDTAVVCDDAILGKPRDREHAAAMLRSLSGRSHRVLTAVAVTGPAGLLSTCVTTRVWLREITDAEIAAYWATGEPSTRPVATRSRGGRRCSCRAWRAAIPRWSACRCSRPPNCWPDRACRCGTALCHNASSFLWTRISA